MDINSIHRSKAFTLIFLLFHSLEFSKACHGVDKETLSHFKHSTISDPSKLFHSWLFSSDCCVSWQGIDCDPSGRVAKVSHPGLFIGPEEFLVETSMSDTLSPYLGNLSFLRVLDLSNLKDLRGLVPPELGKLSHLTHLFLDSNKLKGPIPFTFRRLYRLKKLYLSENSLSGAISSSVFGAWRSLSELGQSRNRFSGSILASIGS